MDGVCLIASAVQRLSIKSAFGEVFHSCFYVDKAGMSLSLEAAGICDALPYHTNKVHSEQSKHVHHFPPRF